MLVKKGEDTAGGVLSGGSFLGRGKVLGAWCLVGAPVLRFWREDQEEWCLVGLFGREGVRVASWRESSSGRMNPQSSFGFLKRGC